MGKIIAIANQKGGVGKTTTAVNLSACLGDLGKKVLVCDMDPQANATDGLGIDKDALEYSVYDALINDMPVSVLIKKTESKNVDVIPSGTDLSGAEVELVDEEDREKKLKKQLDTVKDQYDFIIIDCPPAVGMLSLNGLVAADSLLITLQCEYYALEGLGRVTNTFQLVKQHMNPNLQLEGILLTMFDGRTKLSLEVEEEVRSHFKKKVYKTMIPRNVRLSEAPGFGKTIIQYDARSKGALAYRALAKEVRKANG
ncbi:MAG: ParA family protein [Bacillota bacterium]|jgi:chromosome partitioning protein